MLLMILAVVVGPIPTLPISAAAGLVYGMFTGTAIAVLGALAGSIEAQKESVAFWVNAYNFFMLEQILTERPDGQLVASVWDYGGRDVGAGLHRL
ncbi:hypothetical protein LCGC14_0588170 [marine sediment metagenome]|uniref:Uncharacterized protein n=1 Tax=marine sediment metagenome TaxID=412755 RepID=A0A0F9U0J3_9ZZZZ